MPFIRENIALDGLSLRDALIPKQEQHHFDQYQKIIATAKQEAEHLLIQAQNQAQAIIYDAEQTAHTLQDQAKKDCEDIHAQTQATLEDLKNSTVADAQKAVFDSAQDMLSQLQQAQSNLIHISEPFIKKIMRNIIDKFTQDIELKDKLYILSTQVLEKSRQLENGIWYFHPSNLHQLPKLSLPPSWQILTDETLSLDSCKLSISGSEWQVSFENMRHLLLEWFDDQSL